MSTTTSTNPKVKASQINTIARFKSFIASMVPGVHYDMPEGFPYKWLEIDFDMLKTNRRDKEAPYSWSAERNYKKLGSVGYVFPTKGNYVKYWSKEETAKAQLFKELNWMYNPSGTIQARYSK